jgi:hypothetical protein
VVTLLGSGFQKSRCARFWNDGAFRLRSILE